jgi:hypothetical protein
MPRTSKRLHHLTATSSSDDADMQEEEKDEEEEEPSCEIEKNVLNKVCKAWTAYFGDLAIAPEDDYYAEVGEDLDMPATKDRGIDYYCE